MASSEAEIEAIWQAINQAWSARMDKFIQLCVEHKTADSEWDLRGQEAKLNAAIRKLPAYVIDQVREEIPMTAQQLQLYYDDAREKGLYIADYDTF